MEYMPIHPRDALLLKFDLLSTTCRLKHHLQCKGCPCPCHQHEYLSMTALNHWLDECYSLRNPPKSKRDQKR